MYVCMKYDIILHVVVNGIFKMHFIFVRPLHVKTNKYIYLIIYNKYVTTYFLNSVK